MTKLNIIWYFIYYNIKQNGDDKWKSFSSECWTINHTDKFVNNKLLKASFKAFLTTKYRLVKRNPLSCWIKKSLLWIVNKINNIQHPVALCSIGWPGFVKMLNCFDICAALLRLVWLTEIDAPVTYVKCSEYEGK